MKRILVTGADGFVGGHLCTHLASAGLSIKAATRRPPHSTERMDSIEHCQIASIGRTTDWSAALEDVEAVVHLAARVHTLDARSKKDLKAFREVNVEGTRTLARACIRAGVRRIVMMSSVKAMGEETARDQPFAEDSPCRPRDAYGISKWEAEQTLWEVAAGSRMEVVILRAPLVYGPGVSANFLRLLRSIDRGVPLPLGSVKNVRSLLFVRNLTDAIAICLDHPAAAGQVFLVADQEAFSTRELVLQLAMLLRRNHRLVPVPTPVLRMGGWLLGRCEDIRRLTGSLRVSTAKIRGMLEWRPPFTAVEGLQSTVAWYRTIDLVSNHPSGRNPEPHH